jgi:antirestriction protein ArdC
MKKKTVYDIVTDKIISIIEKEEKLIWRPTFKRYGLAKNFVSGNNYQGINMLLLNFATSHEVPYYLTMKQANKLGGSVKKGSKPEMVVNYNISYKNADKKTITKEEYQQLKDKGEKVNIFKSLRYYNVFNITDTEGIKYKLPELKIYDNQIIKTCEKVVSQMPQRPKIIHEKATRAYYTLNKDYVNIPKIELHESSEDYYNTLFHELVHSTGHPKRINRSTITTLSQFGDITYSEEELVAELGASFLAAYTGIDRESLMKNNAAYLKGWVSKFRDNKKMILKAAAEAQKAVNWIVS